MEFCSAYEKYLNCLIEVTNQLRNELLLQEKVTQNERNAISAIENKYMAISDELHHALKTVQEQYQSVRESYIQITGIKRPLDQRPSATNLSWKDAVRIQEQAATAIRNWFSTRSQQAFIERQRKVHEEALKQTAMALAQAENAKRKAEQAAQAEKERAEAFVESLKRKYRGY